VNLLPKPFEQKPTFQSQTRINIVYAVLLPGWQFSLIYPQPERMGLEKIPGHLTIYKEATGLQHKINISECILDFACILDLNNIVSEGKVKHWKELQRHAAGSLLLVPVLTCQLGSASTTIKE
jgi:hypothetical protein